jgi:hypothetical protein
MMSQFATSLGIDIPGEFQYVPPYLRASRRIDGAAEWLGLWLPTHGERYSPLKVTDHLWVHHSALPQTMHDLEHIASLGAGIRFLFRQGEEVSWPELQSELEEAVDVNRQFAGRLIGDVKAFYVRVHPLASDRQPLEVWEVPALEDYYQCEASLIQAIARHAGNDIPPGSIRRAMEWRSQRGNFGPEHQDAIATVFKPAAT